MRLNALARRLWLARLMLPAIALLRLSVIDAPAQTNVMEDGPLRAIIAAKDDGNLRTYELSSNAELRDNQPPDKHVTISESADHARARTGNILFDGLYAMAVSEALKNSVAQIKDGAYNHGEPIPLEAFQTGEFWTYVWTRDLSYSVRLALAGFDPHRAASSLLFKTSPTKESAVGGFTNQIVQDTGSGGSYPISSDRVVWCLGADATLNALPDSEQKPFLEEIYPLLHDTLEQDRRLIFDTRDGLYRGEQSFLDWREQTYPLWTKDNVVAIGMSKALSVNVADYAALRTASDYAKRLGKADESQRYAGWAADLKMAINRNFYDAQAGMYSTYLLADSPFSIRAHRYDLLGESLAILLGVADEKMARSIITHYPIGSFGPPVMWPQERSVPIYHNRAIWPFVTAFWIEAARKAGNEIAVENGMDSLIKHAALNLSNMENYDFVTGSPNVTDGTLKGPVVDSRRQLWSVAGYLALVENVIFGLEVSADGIRFQPYISAATRNMDFAKTNLLVLQQVDFHGRKIDVRLHLPPMDLQTEGNCSIQKSELNGKNVGDNFVTESSLQPQNQWDVYLGAAHNNKEDHSLNEATLSDEQRVYAPAMPEWDALGGNGITVEEGVLTLHFHAPATSNIVYNIYRDGERFSHGVTAAFWRDIQSRDHDDIVHFYTLEAEDTQSGLVSHLTTSRAYTTTTNQTTIRAGDMEHTGGTLGADGAFMNWGKPGDELRVKTFAVPHTGQYAIRSLFANGAGPVNTGITCGVKRLDIADASGKIVGGGYLVMPQSGNWQRRDLSSIIRAELKAGQTYSARIFEDEYSRNMSYLAANARYTSNNGGGENTYNFVNIAGLQFQRIAR